MLFLVQLVPMLPIGMRHPAQTWQSDVIISSAFAAGRGKQNSNGNASGGIGKGGSRAPFGPPFNAAESSTPKGQGRDDNSGSMPADKLSNPDDKLFDLPASAIWAIDKPPDLDIDLDLPIGKLLKQLNDPKENAGGHHGHYSEHGIGQGKGNKEQVVKGKETSESRRYDSFPAAVLRASLASSYVQKEVLVHNLSRTGLDRAQALGFTVQGALLTQEDEAITTLAVPAGMSAVEAMAILEKELPADRFHLNRIYRLYHPAANDGPISQAEGIEPASRGGALKCLDDRCYGRTAIQWQDGFANCAGNVKIGIIDTDVDLQHQAFSGRKIIQGIFLPDGKRLADREHGTGILALLAGRPDSGTPGLVPQATFLVASIFFTSDDGEPVTDTLSLLRALDWMSISDARFVNMSFSGPQDELVAARIRTLYAKGVAFAAAAGNQGLAADPSYPAAYPQVIAVTAVDKDLQIYPSASRGAYIDVAAPGVHVWTALPNSREGYLSGTSFAVPFMTAVLAIQPPETLPMSKDELLDQVKTVRLGAPGYSRAYGRGLLQAPSQCSNIGEFVTDWAPTPNVSLR